MANERKTLIGLVAVVVVAGLAFVAMGPLVGVGVLVVGVLAGVAVMRRSADNAPTVERRPRPRKGAGGSPLDTISALDATITPATGAAPLPTWTPPTDVAPTEVTPVDEPESDGTWSEPAAWHEGSTWSDANVATDTNPLDDLERLDDVDVVAEVERLEARDMLGEDLVTQLHEFDELAPDGHGHDSLTLVPPINESVSTADDIMAASQATELTITESAGDNTELAKLLAKVQARLAAYE